MWVLLHYRVSALLLYVFCLGYVMALELIELRVPTHIPVGIRVTLSCHWALAPSDVLYSVKWYKDGKEFFRFVPRDKEPRRRFLLPGVDVKEFNSSGSSLTLASAVQATSGRYRCEVSGERPRFRTVSKYADMLAIDLPSHGLIIDGFESQYHAGNYVNVSCCSQPEPQVKLAWYINGEPILPIIPQSYVENNGATSLRLEFTVEKKLVGNLKLQCLATIPSGYWQSIEKSALVSETTEDKEDAHIFKESAVLTYPTNANSGIVRIKRQNFLLSSILILYYFCLS